MNVVVLYEDSMGVGGAFPFHDLVTRSVADRLQVTPDRSHQLHRRMAPHPRNGADKVMADLRNEERLARWRNRSPGWHVVAVFDRDQVHRAAHARADCKASVTHAVLEVVQESHRPFVKVVFLEQNLESVIEAIRSFVPSLAAHAEFDQALAKRVFARDSIFQKAASRPDVREALLARVPSFAYLVDRIAERLA